MSNERNHLDEETFRARAEFLIKERQHIDQQSRQTRADFLVNDAEMALSMLDLADTTKSAENRARRRRAAAKAYTTILRFIPNSQLTEVQRETLNQRLGRIRSRLRAK